MNKLFLEIDFAEVGLKILKKQLYQRKVFPVFFENISTDKTEIGYGDRKSNEFFLITINFTTAEVSVERDVKSTLVLYYKFLKNRLIISSEISDFASGLSLEVIDINYILYIFSQGMSTSSTILKDVSVMYPERKYIFRLNYSSIELINNEFEIIYYIDELPARIFNDYTSSHLGFEISGGKDSSFFPFLCKYSEYKNKLKNAFGIELGGKPGIIQKNSTDQICKFLGVEQNYYKMKEADYPFLEISNYLIPFDLREENYYCSFLGEIELLKETKIDTVFNGIGGDEMFMVPIPFLKKSDGCRIFNEKYREDIKKTEFKEVGSNGFSNSIYDAVISRNAMFTRNGIWQVSPFHDKAVYHFFKELGTSKEYFYDYYYNIFGEGILEIFNNNQNFIDYFWSYTNTKFFKDCVAKLVNLNIINQYLDWDVIRGVLQDDEKTEENIDHRYRIFLCIKVYFSVRNLDK